MTGDSDLGMARLFGAGDSRAKVVGLVDDWVETRLKPANIDDEKPDAPQAVLALLAEAGGGKKAF